jgi:septum formation protein
MAEGSPHHRPGQVRDASSGLAEGRTSTLVLASGSPRRLELLHAAGFAPEVEAADIDDSSLVLGDVGAAMTATSLAYFKARRVASQRRRRCAEPAWILAADTVCERDGDILGKPVDERHAREMIGSLAARRHGVLTGWCLLSPEGSVRLGLARAEVDLGVLPTDDFERFLSEGRWQGKAGGYNFADRVEAGWPLSCDGDPETVMGLPSRILLPLLRGEAASR